MVIVSLNLNNTSWSFILIQWLNYIKVFSLVAGHKVNQTNGKRVETTSCRLYMGIGPAHSMRNKYGYYIEQNYIDTRCLCRPVGLFKTSRLLSSGLNPCGISFASLHIQAYLQVSCLGNILTERIFKHSQVWVQQERKQVKMSCRNNASQLKLNTNLLQVQGKVLVKQAVGLQFHIITGIEYPGTKVIVKNQRVAYIWMVDATQGIFSSVVLILVVSLCLNPCGIFTCV